MKYEEVSVPAGGDLDPMNIGEAHTAYVMAMRALVRRIFAALNIDTVPATVEEALTAMRVALTERDERMVNRVASIVARHQINHLIVEELQTHFDQVDAQLVTLNERMAALTERLVALDERILLVIERVTATPTNQ